MDVLLVVAALAICAIIYKKLKRRAVEDWDVPEEILARMMPDEFPAYKKMFAMQDESAYFVPFRHS